MKCAAHGCVNTSEGGYFAGPFCMPCIDALKTGKAEHGTSWIFTQQARLAEAEQLILRMSGEGFIRAKFYVEKYDLTGERAADSAPAAPVAHNRRWSDGEPEIIVRTGDKEKEVARMVSDHAKVIASKQNTCPYCGAVQGQAHQSTCIAAAAASADPVINAQHDETGRTWRGPRSQLPSRYFEVEAICCLDYPRCDCNSPPEPDNAPALQPCGHPWKAQHDSKCILCSSPGVTP